MAGSKKGGKQLAKVETARAMKKQNRSEKEVVKKERGKRKGNEWKEHWSKFDTQLRALGLQLRDVKGDGNCLFRSVADQLHGTESKHVEVRDQTVNFIVEHDEDFSPFVEGSFADYCKKMAKDGEWGGNMELAAMSRALSVHFVIHQCEAPRFEIRNPDSEDVPTLHIAYHDHEHYSSVRALGDLSHLPSADMLKAVQMPASSADAKRAADLDSLSRSERIVMQNTGCNNAAFVRQTLKDANGDIDVATELLIALREAGDDEFYGVIPPELQAALDAGPQAPCDEKGLPVPTQTDSKPADNSGASASKAAVTVTVEEAPRSPALNAAAPSTAPSVPSPSLSPAANPKAAELATEPTEKKKNKKAKEKPEIKATKGKKERVTTKQKKAIAKLQATLDEKKARKKEKKKTLAALDPDGARLAADFGSVMI